MLRSWPRHCRGQSRCREWPHIPGTQQHQAANTTKHQDGEKTIYHDKNKRSMYNHSRTYVQRVSVGPTTKPPERQ